jgi:16S rRNA processing protein RimM
LSISSTESLILEVGRVVRPHGIHGQVVVELSTNRTERVAEGSRLDSPAGELEVLRSSPQGAVGGKPRWVVSFAGIDTRDQAEALRNVVLSAAPIADSGVLWVHELIGAEVVDTEGSRLGIVEAVEANPASDLLVLDGGGLIPLRFVTDRQPGRLTVDVPPGLLDL